MIDALPTPAQAVAEQLVWVAHFWPDLAESRLPGTARPWRQPHLTGEQADERDRQAREERQERVGVMPGEHPAPVDVGVLDTMASILWDATVIADEINWRVLDPAPEAPSTAYADARPFLDYAAAHITDDLAEWAAPIAQGMVNQMAAALALVLDGQLLDVVCPWCGGKTDDAPIGGARTWWIHILPGDQVAIVCTGNCEPPQREVGTWWQGKPCWPLGDWEGLAKRVQTAEACERIAS